MNTITLLAGSTFKCNKWPKENVLSSDTKVHVPENILIHSNNEIFLLSKKNTFIVVNKTNAKKNTSFSLPIGTRYICDEVEYITSSNLSVEFKSGTRLEITKTNLFAALKKNKKKHRDLFDNCPDNELNRDFSKRTLGQWEDMLVCNNKLLDINEAIYLYLIKLVYMSQSNIQCLISADDAILIDKNYVNKLQAMTLVESLTEKQKVCENIDKLQAQKYYIQRAIAFKKNYDALVSKYLTYTLI